MKAILFLAAFAVTTTLCSAQVLKQNKADDEMKYLPDSLPQIEEDWCQEFEPYFQSHCPAEVEDYTGCCLCTQYYYYSCSCCADIVDKFGVGGDAEVCLTVLKLKFQIKFCCVCIL